MEQEGFQEEADHLRMVTALLCRRLAEGKLAAAEEKQNLTALNRQMWENTVHFSEDFSRLTEANQELGNIEARMAGYRLLERRVRQYERMQGTPYFARVDFAEDGYDCEKIYIGAGSLTDDDGLDAYVYDWRAPIAGLFYQSEPGRVSYRAPSGEISGEMTLKRQYEIKNGELRYFFDSSVNVMDEVLRSVLSQNSSPKMRSIVETIQREQDTIIRDRQNDLLLVQGTAGSGKTSVALHRVAFLMYQGMADALGADNILILSPNALFGRYISGVLPELGEETVCTKTFEDLYHDIFGEEEELETRNDTLEQIVGEDVVRGEQMKNAMNFQLSSAFLTLLDRMIEEYEQRLLPFCDFSYAGTLLATAGQLRAQLAQSRVKMPLVKRLRVLEENLLGRVHAQKAARLSQLEAEVRRKPEHQFEVRQQARLFSIKESSALAHELRALTRVNARTVYNALFEDQARFFRLAEGLPLPEDAEVLFGFLAARLKSGTTGYADGMALLYLHGRITGARGDGRIRQVVVDEAQDYHPVHFRILAELLPNARYTVLGDVNQTIAGTAEPDWYGQIRDILNKRHSALAVMNKSFRCSTEINRYSRRFFAEGTAPDESFERSEREPELRCAPDQAALDALLLQDMQACADAGLESGAVLCKSMARAKELFYRLRALGAPVRLAGEQGGELGRGVSVMPIYLAKGLEFDAAFVADTDAQSYTTPDDRRLLYVAATRPLHRLYLYCAGEPSPLLGTDVPG